VPAELSFRGEVTLVELPGVNFGEGARSATLGFGLVGVLGFGLRGPPPSVE
jgi:hypothetical protein